MPPEAHVLQWRMRADVLIGEATMVHATLAAALSQFRTVATTYANAKRSYIAAFAHGDEQHALIELVHRAERRSAQMLTRQGISQNQAATEQELFFIHYGIYMTQFLIAMGKIAEIGLSFAGTIKSLKIAVDEAKLAVDGFKAAQPVAAGVIAGVSSGRSNPGATNVALTSGQIVAVLVRMNSDLAQWGKSLTDIIGTIRRTRGIQDKWTAAEALAQLMKLVFEQVKLLIAAIEGSNVSGMAGAAGSVAAVMSILRDAVAAIRAFIAMYDEFQEMKQSAERMERWIAEGNRYMGSEQLALEHLAEFTTISDSTVDDIMGMVHDFQTAQALADRSRRDAERLGNEMAAAGSLRRHASGLYKSALANVEPYLKLAAEKLDRFALLIVDMNFVAEGRGINRSPADLAESKAISERLIRQRDVLRSVMQQYQMPALGS